MSTSRAAWPLRAMPAARLIAVVVLPTPPFWLATAMTRVILLYDQITELLLKITADCTCRQLDSESFHVKRVPTSSFLRSTSRLRLPGSSSKTPASLNGGTGGMCDACGAREAQEVAVRAQERLQRRHHLLIDAHGANRYRRHRFVEIRPREQLFESSGQDVSRAQIQGSSDLAEENRLSHLDLDHIQGEVGTRQLQGNRR